MDPDWWLTPEAFLLREIEHGIRVLQWQQTENGAKRRMHTFPQPIPLTEVEQRKRAQEKGQIDYDAVPLEDARTRLGWDKT